MPCWAFHLQHLIKPSQQCTRWELLFWHVGDERGDLERFRHFDHSHPAAEVWGEGRIHVVKSPTPLEAFYVQGKGQEYEKISQVIPHLCCTPAEPHSGYIWVLRSQLQWTSQFCCWTFQINTKSIFLESPAETHSLWILLEICGIISGLNPSWEHNHMTSLLSVIIIHLKTKTQAGAWHS